MRSRSLRTLARHAEHCLYRFRYRMTPDTLGPLGLSGPCLLLGSAPGAKQSPDFDSDWALVTVNASQACLPASQGLIPDLTIMSDGMLGSSEANQVAQCVLKGARTVRLVLISRAMQPRVATQHLNTLGYSYEKLICLSHWGRAKIVYDVLGEHLGVGDGGDKLSTGVFALLLLIRSQVKPIVTSGLSLVTDGHAYDKSNVFPRAHKDVDRHALGLIAKQYRDLFVLEQTTESVLPFPNWPKHGLK